MMRLNRFSKFLPLILILILSMAGCNALLGNTPPPPPTVTPLPIVDSGAGEESVEFESDPALIQSTPTPSPTPPPTIDAWLIYSSPRDGRIQMYLSSWDGELISKIDVGDDIPHVVWPNVSPDGTQIVFAGVQGERAQFSLGLFISNIDGSNVRELRRGDGMHPRWSPDGTRIAYSCNDSTDVCIINADGTGLINLTTNTTDSSDYFPSWTPDGNLVFMSDRDRPSNFYGQMSEIYYINTSTLEISRLTFDDTGFDGYPRVSPDGLRIAFVTNREDPSTTEIYTSDINGNDLWRLTADEYVNYAPDWAADSQTVIYGQDSGDGNHDLWRAHYTGNNFVRLTRLVSEDGGLRFGHSGLPVAVTVANVIEEQGEFFRPDLPRSSQPVTNAVIFAANDFNCDICLDTGIYTVNFDGANLLKLPVQGFYPVWSPDFRRFAFIRQGELYIASTSGEEAVQVTRAFMGFGAIAWAPNGQRIAAECAPYGQPDICLIDVATGAVQNITRELTLDTGVTDPAWFRSDILVYDAIVDTDGTIVNRLPLPGKPSADGFKIVTIQDGQLYTANSDGSEAGPLVTDNSTKGFPRWSPDGSLIIYSVAPGDGGIYLWAVQVNGNNPIALVNVPIAAAPLGFVGEIRTYFGYNWGP